MDPDPCNPRNGPVIPSHVLISPHSSFLGFVTATKRKRGKSARLSSPSRCCLEIAWCRSGISFLGNLDSPHASTEFEIFGRNRVEIPHTYLSCKPGACVVGFFCDCSGEMLCVQTISL
ncbi:hypothetical protein MRB53_031548 [Persea americana]|uniref:Uncharacterized protein n=1 Tax=Persea americana TaxID=3435 RepID=A0ACC2KPC1_PERAE|nr:hypothetical protein MRB53_031548 [Persea americana]